MKRITWNRDEELMLNRNKEKKSSYEMKQMFCFENTSATYVHWLVIKETHSKIISIFSSVASDNLKPSVVLAAVYGSTLVSHLQAKLPSKSFTF